MMKSSIISTLLSLILILLTEFTVTGNERGPGVTVVVSEGSDAILPCSLSTKESLVQKLFDWRKVDQKIKEVFMYDAGLHYNNGLPGQNEQFRGRVSHFPDQLQFGNASIIIRNTRVADSGNYTCAFPRLQSEQTFNIKLVVGASTKADLFIVNKTEDWALLKCKVQGFPKPKVEWQDSDGNLLPAEEEVSYRGDRYYITLLTTVTRTKTNLFHCVATQEELSHRTVDKIYVPYYAAAPNPEITILGGNKAGVQLQCHVGGAFPQPKLQWQDSDGNVLPAEALKVSERGGHYNVTLCTTVTLTKTNCFHCVVTQEGSYQVMDHKIILSENLFKGTSGDVLTGWLAGWFIGLLSLALVQAVLVKTKCITIRSNRGCLGNTNGPSEKPRTPDSESRELRSLNGGLV